MAIAAIVGIIYAMLFGLDASSIDLGSAEHSRGTEISKQAKDLTANTLPQQILELLPSNPFLDFTGQRTTSTIAVVIFATFVGFAYLRVARKQPQNGSLLKRGIDAIYALVMAIVTFVLRLTPYGILAIMSSTIATSDFAAIWTLGKFMLASYAALITMYMIHLIILGGLGLNPIKYMKKHSKLWSLRLHHVQAQVHCRSISKHKHNVLVSQRVLLTSQQALVYQLVKTAVPAFIQQCLLSW